MPRSRSSLRAPNVVAVVGVAAVNARCRPASRSGASAASVRSTTAAGTISQTARGTVSLPTNSSSDEAPVAPPLARAPPPTRRSSRRPRTHVRRASAAAPCSRPCARARSSQVAHFTSLTRLRVQNTGPIVARKNFPPQRALMYPPRKRKRVEGSIYDE